MYIRLKFIAFKCQPSFVHFILESCLCTADNMTWNMLIFDDQSLLLTKGQLYFNLKTPFVYNVACYYIIKVNRCCYWYLLLNKDWKLIETKEYEYCFKLQMLKYIFCSRIKSKLYVDSIVQFFTYAIIRLIREYQMSPVHIKGNH